MRSFLKSLVYQVVSVALALLILALTSLDPGPPQGDFQATRLLPDPTQSCLLPVGGGPSLFELPLLVRLAPESPRSERGGSEVKGPSPRVVPSGALLAHVKAVRHALGHQ
ncbi:MAG: hypothetical protein ACYTG7_26250, partial [Planctomycetota bacterium]